MILVLIAISIFILVVTFSSRPVSTNVVIRHDEYDLAQLRVQQSINRYLSMPRLVLKRHWCDPRYFDLMNRRCLKCGKTDLEIAMIEPYPSEEQLNARTKFMNQV
jgi:hypothetical protein